MPMTQCLVCGRAGFDSYLDILLKCPNCGFVTAKRDESADVTSLYQGDYFTGGEYLDYLADEAFFKKTFRKRLQHLLRRRSSGRLLEIGSAYGFFLDLAKEYFDVIGYEVNKQAAEHARRQFHIDVRNEDFLQADSGKSVDVTVMWDVIEHLEQPDLYIKKIADISKIGALLYITTADIGSFIARLRGRNWRMIHPPTHLHYFDRATLSRLLENHGFEVSQIRTVGVARSLRQILYSTLVLGMGMPTAYDRLKRIVPAGWGFTLNSFDIIMATARKKGD